ncbi:MAG: peptidoglycan-binding domain-containing protein [Gammaproteobacteria bacterium]|jgi:hypothetical protein
MITVKIYEEAARSLLRSLGVGLLVLLASPGFSVHAADLKQQKEVPRDMAPVAHPPEVRQQTPQLRVDEGRVRGCTWVGCCGCKCCGDIEMKLKQAGFDPGSVDGIVTDKTRAALRAYQQSRNLDVTGQFNSDTQKSMGLGDQLKRMK